MFMFSRAGLSRHTSKAPRRLLGTVLTLAFLFGSCARPPLAVPTPPSPAESPTPAVQAPEPAGDTPGLFLYAAERDGNTTHLLGTIHLGFGFAQVLTPEGRSRFQAARLVMAEMDPGTEMSGRVMEAGMLPRGESARPLLGEPLYSAIVARLAPKMPEPVVSTMKPWLIGLVIAMEELGEALQKRGSDAQTHRMDEEMLEAARAAGKPLAFFETAGEQLGFLEAVPVAEQREELSHMLTAEARSQTEAMVSAYAAGDERSLTAACFTPEHMQRAPAFFEEMLYARNARWLPVVLREHAAGGSFVGVGVAHLLGERGLVAELRAQGFTVRRIQ
jgi:uncharacterized protein YbaP (TraB family)